MLPPQNDAFRAIHFFIVRFLHLKPQKVLIYRASIGDVSVMYRKNPNDDRFLMMT